MLKTLAELARLTERYDLDLSPAHMSDDQARMALDMIEDYLDIHGARWLKRNWNLVKEEIKQRL